MTGAVCIVSDTTAQSVEVVATPIDPVVVVEESGAQTFEIVENSSPAIQVIDPQTGGFGIDGVPVIVRDPKVGDVISYNGAVFANRAQEDITDGGNF